MSQEELRDLLIKRVVKEKQSYICKTIGISEELLSQFKNGKKNLGVENAQKLEKYLNNKE